MLNSTTIWRLKFNLLLTRTGISICKNVLNLTTLYTSSKGRNLVQSHNFVLFGLTWVISLHTLKSLSRMLNIGKYRLKSGLKYVVLTSMNFRLKQILFFARFAIIFKLKTLNLSTTENAKIVIMLNVLYVELSL